MVTYKQVTDAMAIINASGIVRVGRATSPLAHRALSIPVSANAARMIALPGFSGLQFGGREKFDACTAKAPTTTKTASGSSLSAVVAMTNLAPLATPWILTRET